MKTHFNPDRGPESSAGARLVSFIGTIFVNNVLLTRDPFWVPSATPSREFQIFFSKATYANYSGTEASNKGIKLQVVPLG